jgi:YVTN family beta-propeller protein
MSEEGGELVEFRVLGDLEVWHAGQAISLGAHQQRAVLAILVLNVGEVVSSDRLIDALWGDEPPPRAAKTVQVYVSRLRKALAAEGSGAASAPIVTREHGYMLDVDPDCADARRFEGLLEHARIAADRGDAAAAAGLLERALALWRGRALSDFTFDAFAAREIARLEELRAEAVEARIDADLQLGRHATLVAELEALTAEHPMRERLCALRMLALYRCGRQCEALEVYRRARETLVQELGIEPAAALRELEQAILRQDPALEAPAAIEPPPYGGGRGRPRWRRAAVAAATLSICGAVVVAVLALRGHGARPIAVEPNSVAVIDPGRNAVVRQVAVGVRPADIAVGAGGLWVANLDDDSASQIDPRAARVTRNLTIGRSIDALTTADGALWTVDSPHATLVRIDPAFRDVVRRVRLGPDEPSAIPDPIAARGGSVWAAGGGAAVWRIGARSRRPVRVDVGTEPAGIAVGAGATWVSDDLDDTVTRIDTAGVVTATIPVGRGAGAIAVGAGGVWVADTLADSVTRIDPATGAPRTTIPVGAAPRGIAVGAGAVWVANSGDGTVSRIDPTTNHVKATITIGGSPAGVAFAAGRVWVTVQAAAARPAPAGPGGTLRVVQEQDFNSTDPALLAGYGPQAGQLAFATCAKLLDYPDTAGPAGTRLTPEVAASMPTVSPDRRTYTFTIRRGFAFSSGQPVTARAFQRAFERYLSPRMQPDGGPAVFLSDIVGFRAYRSHRSRRLAGVTATNTTLTIRTVRPAENLPARVAMPFLCAVPPDTPIRPGGVDGIPSAGPYYIASHVPGRALVLRRNPHYHGARPHRLAEIDYRFGVPPTRAVALVRSGQAEYANATIGDSHFARAVPPAEQATLDRRYGAHSAAARAGHQRYFINRTPDVLYYVLNGRRGLFASARMRRAANFAIDRAALARNVFAVSATPTDQYLPVPMPGFTDADIYPLGAPNVVQARRLAAGHHGTAVMYTCTTPDCLRRAEIIKANLRAIGIGVRIRQFPLPEMFRREFSGRQPYPYDIATLGWTADYADPSDFIDLLFTDPTAPVRLAPRYRREITAASRLAGPARLRAYGRLDVDLAAHAAPFVAFANVTAHDFFSPRIGCQIFQPIYGIDLAALCQQRRGSTEH